MGTWYIKIISKNLGKERMVEIGEEEIPREKEHGGKHYHQQSIGGHSWPKIT